MSGNVDDQTDQSALATAPTCSVSQLEKTSPTAGEPAASSRMKSVSPTSMKKAWRHRLEMDAALAAASATLATLPSTSAASSTESKPIAAGQLHESQLFVCRQCGKYFVTLKYLEMHSALHAGHLTSSAVRVQPPVASLSLVQSRPPQPNPPPPSATLDRPAPNIHRPALPSTASLLNDGFPILLPQTSSNTSAPARYRDWTCDICRKKFSQNSSYKNHQRTHSDERPFVCTVCSIGFKERYHLKKHTLFKHSSEAREQCKVCGKRFKDSTAVRAHERIHSDARPYACRRCHKAFKTSECLWHHENRSKSCGGVAQRLQQLPAVDDAVRRRGRKRGRRNAEQTTGPAVRVSASSMASADAGSTVTATTSIDSSPARLGFHVPALPPTASGLPAACDPTYIRTANSISSAVTGSLSDYPTTGNSTARPQFSPAVAVWNTGHQEAGVEQALSRAGSSHREGLVLLANCAVSRPADVAALTKTQVKVEPEVVLADYELTAMNSPEASFYERKRMAAAETTSASATQAPSSLSDLHIASSVTGSSSRSPGKDVGPLTLASGHIECRECRRQYANLIAYNKHAVVHREQRPYRCEQCDVGFKLRVHLKKHNLYRHTDVYQCECRHCGKRFKDSSAVRLHERIHSTDRPFPCPTCGKTFKTRENLWGHRHRGPCGLLNQSITDARRVSGQPAVEAMTSEEQCLNVEEQLVVDNEVLVHGGDLIPPSSSDSSPLNPLSSSYATGGNVVQATSDQQSVAVVEAGQAAAAAKALLWAYGRTPAFYMSPTAVLSNVPTAVVAPIKREIPDSVPMSTPQQSSNSEAVPDNAFEQSVLSNPAHSQPTPLSKAYLPPFETFRAHAISGGSISMTSSDSSSVTSSAGEPISSAVNLCLATRSTANADAVVPNVTEALPLTSFYRHPPTSSSAALPFPVWSLPTVGLAAEVGTQLLRAADPQSSATDQLVASTTLKPEDGHVTGQLLPVQQTALITVVEATPTSRYFASNDGKACN